MPRALATAGALARRLRKTAVVAGVCDGFIGNRIMAAYRQDCEAMLLKGADPVEIDAAMRGYRRRAWEDWSDTVGIEINHREGMEFDSSLLTYSAAQQGFGLAIGQVQLLEREFQSGRLLRPINCPIPTGASFHVVWPTTISVSTKARHFIDWLLEQAGEQPEFFRRSKSS